MRKYGTTWAVFFLLVVLVIFVFSLTSISRREEPLTYSQLQNLLKEGKADQIQKATLTNGENVGFFKAHITFCNNFRAGIHITNNDNVPRKFNTCA